MAIERDSAHFRILERLCTMPRPVRGIAGAMLDRHFGAPDARLAGRPPRPSRLAQTDKRELLTGEEQR